MLHKDENELSKGGSVQLATKEMFGAMYLRKHGATSFSF
jgi:hypothetical protein